MLLLKRVEGHDFRSLWAAQSISQVGSQITTVALPLAAVSLFDAGPAQMGLLNAAGYLPALLLTLLAGVWIDRSRRRPLLLGADLGRAVMIGLIPVTALAGALGIGGLYLIVLISGALTVLFDTAYHAYVPTLVPSQSLVRANSRLQFSASLAQLAGPGLGGLLVQLLSAPVALAFDALSFLASALFLFRIRHREQPPVQCGSRRLRQEIAEGLRATFGNRYVRPVALEAAVQLLRSVHRGPVRALCRSRPPALRRRHRRHRLDGGGRRRAGRARRRASRSQAGLRPRPHRHHDPRVHTAHRHPPHVQPYRAGRRLLHRGLRPGRV